MKVNGNIWLVIIMFLMILSSCNSKSSKKDIENDFSNLTVKSANELTENLIESFRNKYSTSPALLYPDYYGGSYIADDKLVVFVSGDTISAKQDLSIRCKGSGFAIKSTTYPFYKLTDLIGELSAYLRNRDNSVTIQELKFYGAGINQNRISILLGDTSLANINRFKREVMDSPVFIFEESSPFRFDEEVIEN